MRLRMFVNSKQAKKSKTLFQGALEIKFEWVIIKVEVN